MVSRVRRAVKDLRQRQKLNKAKAKPEWITPAVEQAWQQKLTAGRLYT